MPVNVKDGPGPGCKNEALLLVWMTGHFPVSIVASKKCREMAHKCTGTQTYHQSRLQRPGMMGLPVIIYLGSIIS